MLKIIEINEDSKRDLLSLLSRRSPSSLTEYEEKVNEILEDVKNRGDQAVFDYAKRFDKCELNQSNFKVTEDEIETAKKMAGEELLRVMRASMQNIRAFHERQKRQSFFNAEGGMILGVKVTPLKRVGVYVPGGKAAYPSSVLMNVVPAQAAGVEEIVMTTPADSNGKVNPNVLAAASLLGVSEIYKTGGAQAIGALAFGTESIKKVQKIVGPGNVYVALAKRAVYGHVSIDSIAGPSEIMVLADDQADPRFVAADLLSQAEHDEMASCILVTTDRSLADRVNEEIAGFLPKLERRAIIEKSLENYGFALIAKDEEEAIGLVDEVASEHLEIMTRDPWETMSKVHNAGAIFIGPYSSEPLGDYFAGPNHVLPTNGTAKFFSPLSVDDFIKKSSIISYSKDALHKVHGDIEAFAVSEGLTAHANSIKVRFDEEG